nr:MAG TPA: hypothetical protein [Caudoviricetes sp.]
MITYHTALEDLQTETKCLSGLKFLILKSNRTLID